MRKTFVFVALLLLLAALGISLTLGASKTRAYASRLLDSGAAPSASASSSSGVVPSASAALAPSSSTAPSEPKAAERNLSVIGLGWDLLAPGLLAAEGLKSSKASPFTGVGLKVSFSVAAAMSDVERALASGGAAGGADLAVVPLSELVAAHERLRALDLRVFFVSGWSQGKDTLFGAALTKLPNVGNIGVEYTGGNDALMLALLGIDLTGTALDRVKLGENVDQPLLRSKTEGLLDQAANKQDDVVLSSREAARLLPYVLVAPQPLLEEGESALAGFVQGWLSGADTLLKDRAKAARTLAGFEGAPEALSLLHVLADSEPSRLHENTALLGLSGRGAVSIESLADWQFRARRAAHLGRVAADTSLVDGRVVTRVVRQNPKLLQATEPAKRRGGAGTASEPLLERTFPKEDEEAVMAAIGLLTAVFPRYDVRLTLPGRPAKARAEWLDRAALRYDIDRARLLVGNAPVKNGAAASLQVLRAP